MRKKLTALLARADKTKNMHKRLDIYTAILNTPQNTEYLSAKEIADVFYNRSLNHMEICGSHFSRGEYIEAIKDMRRADSDIKNAEIRYDQTTDISACKQRMSEYRNTRLYIIEVKDGQSDPSMSEFIKVSRLIITTSAAPSSFKDSPIDGYRADTEALDRQIFLPAKRPRSSAQDRLEFFELFAASQAPAQQVIIKQDLHGAPQQPNENGLNFNPPDFFSKTAVLKRKLEKSSLRRELEETTLLVPNISQQQAV